MYPIAAAAPAAFLCLAEGLTRIAGLVLGALRTLCMVVLLSTTGLLLAGCGSTDADNAQTRAGIADAEISTALGPDGTPYISSMRLIDGKERAGVTLTIETPSGHKVIYTAEDVAAFEGQKARADLEREIAAAWKDATPEVVGSIADAVVKWLGPGIIP